VPDSSHPPFNDAQWRFLQEAAAYLEHPSLLTRIANLVGKPVEALLGALPEAGRKAVSQGVQEALRRGLEWAIRTLPAPAEADSPEGRTAQTVAAGEPQRTLGLAGIWRRHGHTALAALSGAGGGFFGLPGLVVELPATTVVMLRSIASIAAEHGADLNDPATRLECLAVLSYGSQPLEEMELSYFSARMAVASAVQQASRFVAGRTAQQVADALANGTAPAVLRLINAVARRFEVAITEKVAAQSVPLVGAGLGALINAAFTDHFNRVATYHFGIVDLERRYGREAVEQGYRLAERAAAGPRLRLGDH
jgi:hypothetical protein